MGKMILSKEQLEWALEVGPFFPISQMKGHRKKVLKIVPLPSL